MIIIFKITDFKRKKVLMRFWGISVLPQPELSLPGYPGFGAPSNCSDNKQWRLFLIETFFVCFFCKSNYNETKTGIE
jgi:hypothetical protein